MSYIYSNLTADNEYSTKAGRVVIYGRLGAKRNRRLETPRGVANEVTDMQLAALKEHPTFLSQLNNNHLSIQTREVGETKLERMEKDGDLQADKAAQETETTLKSKSKAKKAK